MTGWQKIFFQKSCIFRTQRTIMMPGTYWDYTGAFVLILIIIYGSKNYWITLFAGFAVFCVFFFSYGYKIPNFELNFYSALRAIKTAALIYIIPYLTAVIIYSVTKRLNKKVQVGAT